MLILSLKLTQLIIFLKIVQKLQTTIILRGSIRYKLAEITFHREETNWIWISKANCIKTEHLYM